MPDATQRRTCRDGGTCHHHCADTDCFRERTCEPFTGYVGPWGADDWPRPPTTDDWRSMRTAPRDRTPVLVTVIGDDNERGVCVACFDDEQNHWLDLTCHRLRIADPMVGWLPLPQPSAKEIENDDHSNT